MIFSVYDDLIEPRIEQIIAALVSSRPQLVRNSHQE